MNNFLRTSNSNRYIIDDDFIPKVTSDGEPHEMMTLIAGVSGLITAAIILIILVILLGYKKHDKKNNKHINEINSSPLTTVPTKENEKCGSLIPMFITPQQKSELNKHTELSTISIITNQQFGRTNYGYDVNQHDYCPGNFTLKLSEISTGRF